MKPIKILGLAALAALMVAFVDSGSVMAESTALCKEDMGEECPAGQLITHVHEATLAGKKAVLKTSLLTVECDVLFLGDVLNAENLSYGGAEKLIISGETPENGRFTYTNCGGCTFTEENGPAVLAVLRESHETASVTVELLTHSECSGLNCRYNGLGIKLTTKGPLLSVEENGESAAVKQKLVKESGLFCPSTTELTITLTPLQKTYLRA